MRMGTYSVSELPPPSELAAGLTLTPKAKGRRKANTKDYINIICAFDIETTTIRLEDDTPHSFMYIWQFQFGEHYTITGRTWDEFRALVNILKETRQYIPGGRRAFYVVYVHNLAYEFCFLQGVFEIENDNCFFRDTRKPIYVRIEDLIEFRCSYLHSNMTLAKFAENMGCKTQKLSGDEFDYKKVRYPWTPLTDYEYQYCIHDVIALEEALRIEMTRDGDTLRTIPLTSTGYVRRDLKRAVQPLRMSIQQMLPDLQTYNLLRRCFRGGNTQANRYHVGTICGPGESLDIESSYPYQLCTRDFPMTEFKPLADDEDSGKLMKRIMRFIGMGKAVIADYHFKDIRLKNPREPIPYIPISKCHSLNAVDFNDRILSADLVVMSLTEIDLQIILEQYTFSSISAYNAMVATKAPLPQAYRDVVLDYYKTKTLLKGDTEKAYEYAKSKNKLNSTFGCAAQQAIHSKVFYNAGMWSKVLPLDEEAEKELENAAFPYQWGVYCTAYARLSLHEGMKEIPADDMGVSNLLYCDTDSLKYIGHADLSHINRRIQAVSRKCGATAIDGKGERHYMGIWTEDPPFLEFVTQGAKRYAYKDEKGLHVTVSGVSRKPYDKTTTVAARELEHLDNFKPGMVWVEAGGTTAVYNDFDCFDFADPDGGGSVHIGPNVSIVDSTYTMSAEKSDEEIVEMCIQWIKYVKEHEGVYK